MLPHAYLIASCIQLAEFKPTWIEEPTSPDDVLGHAAVARVRPTYLFMFHSKYLIHCVLALTGSGALWHRCRHRRAVPEPVRAGVPLRVETWTLLSLSPVSSSSSCSRPRPSASARSTGKFARMSVLQGYIVDFFAVSAAVLVV